MKNEQQSKRSDNLPRIEYCHLTCCKIVDGESVPEERYREYAIGKFEESLDRLAESLNRLTDNPVSV